MADRRSSPRPRGDVVETVSIATDTSGSGTDRYGTPLGNRTDEDESEPETPKAERFEPVFPATNDSPNRAEQRFSQLLASQMPGGGSAAADPPQRTSAEQTPRAEKIRTTTSRDLPLAERTGAAHALATPAKIEAATKPVDTESVIRRERTPSYTSKLSETGSEARPSGSGDLERGTSDEKEAVGKEETSTTPKDPNIVDWDGPDDPEMGVNWSASKKWNIVASLSFLTLVSPLASSMFAPAVPDVLVEFQTTGIYLSSFVVSVYILGYATGPIVIAPLSELYGRSILYHTTNALFVIFTVACALSTSMGMLIAFRFLAGAAGSAVLTMGAGTMSDLFIQEQRGRAMAVWACGPLLGPVIGPVAGGFLGKAKGWRWIFWVIAMASGVAAIWMFVVLKESYGTIILERRAQRLRKETGNPNLRSALSQGLTPGAEFKRSIIRPLKMLVLSPIVLLLTLYNSVIYGYLYLVFTTITLVFERGYGFDPGVVGLTFIGIGVGMFSGMIIFSIISDTILKRKSAGDGIMKPEYRLPPMGFSAIFVPAGLFIYGWTAEYMTHWFWPIFGTAWLGFGLLGVFMCISTYLVDAYTIYAASAMAANTIVRSLFGALIPLAGPSLYQALGLGWGNSLLGFIAVAMIPIPFFFLKYGERIRTNPRFQPNW